MLIYIHFQIKYFYYRYKDLGEATFCVISYYITALHLAFLKQYVMEISHINWIDLPHSF